MIRDVQKKRSSPDPKLIQIQLFFSAGKKKSFFHYSHGLATPATNTGQRDAEKTIPGHEQGTSMGKGFLSISPLKVEM